MAKAMNIVDVFKILLDGGWIVRRSPAVKAKNEYKTVTVEGDCSGHISEKQFEELRFKGILDVASRAKQDDVGDIYTLFCLARKVEV